MDPKNEITWVLKAKKLASEIKEGNYEHNNNPGF